MRRFTFASRLGAVDKATIPLLQADSTFVPIQFIDAYDRLDYGLGAALDSLHRLGRQPPEVAIDLAILAATINAADTRVSRNRNAQDGWTREIDIVVAVSDTVLWTAQGQILGHLLRFLTGDHWRITFRDRPAGKARLAQLPTVLPLLSFDNVALLSGGLDSLVGAIDALATGQRPLFLSHWYDAETSKAQKAVLHHLEKRFPGDRYRSIRVRLGFDRHQVSTGETENSQRGRSFLFFALAVLAASALTGQVKVSVPENGLIGLNVPLDPLRLGALSTRTTHPHYMASFNTLLARLGLSVALVNPYRHKTKGEMVAECADLGFLKSVVPYSMSCSAPAKARYKGLSPRHCGTCVPCLIRRASLEHGLGEKDDTLYSTESLTARPLDSAKAEGEHVRSFQLLAGRLAEKPSLAGTLARIPGPLNDDPAEFAAYVDVFRRGIQEVAVLLNPVHARPE